MPQQLLMIEDDNRLAAMVGDYLRQSGYVFTHAADGNSGLAALDNSEPDLVILDLMLPDMDGLEVCRRIKNRSTQVPVQGHDEVAFLAERFNNAAKRIETLVDSQKALLNAHKNLLANAPHELRSPLTRIRMGLEMLNADIASPQRIEISRSITELDQLIDEILLASRLDSGQTDTEPMELLDLTGLAAEECSRVNADLTADLRHASEAHNAHSLQLHGSPRLLRRLLRNLLENAKRYSDGDITLALSQGGSAAQPTAVIRVSDHGPGVPTQHRERIFEPFYRLPGASERDGGVGLGLALVKSIAERHSGRVHCEGNPGGGASFVVELPIQLNDAG